MIQTFPVDHSSHGHQTDEESHKECHTYLFLSENIILH